MFSQKCEENGYEVVYHIEGKKAREERSTRLNPEDYQQEGRLEDTFNMIWNEIARKTIDDFEIFNTNIRRPYPEKGLRVGNGTIVPLDACPSDLNEDMKW